MDMVLERLTKIPPDSSLGKLLRAPVRAVPGGAVVKVRGGVNRGMKWVVGSSIHSCWLGVYEADKQRTLEPFVKPGMTVFDLGANAGFYTLAFSRLVGEGGQVWAFEPLAENARNILRHTELNGLRNVTLFQAVVTDSGGVAGFEVGENNSSGRVSERSSYRVPAVSLDSLIEKGDAPAPDLIKLDVEGAESLVLNGAVSLLRTKKPVLFIALHGDKEAAHCRTILAESGYCVYRLDGSRILESELASEDEIYALPG